MTLTGALTRIALGLALFSSAAMANDRADTATTFGRVPPIDVPLVDIVEAKVVVTSPAELDDLLRSRRFVGKVIIPKDQVWKMERCDHLDEFGRPFCAPLREIPLYDGIELIGERGELGSRPLLFTTLIDKLSGYALFEVCGNNVRVEGLRRQGPLKGDDHADSHYFDPDIGFPYRHKLPYTHGIRVFVKRDGADSPCTADIGNAIHTRMMGERVVIADNEFDQWMGGAVTVVGAHSNLKLSLWADHTCHTNPEGGPVCCEAAEIDGNLCWRPPVLSEAGLVRVERNFMHHNAMDGGGYGVVVSGGAFVTVMGNVFNYNRHAVAATGMGHSGYVARFNYVLQGGYQEEHGLGGNLTSGYYNQHFDIHGEDGGYGGPGGTFFDISFNTVRGAQKYYVTKTRPGLLQRGVPAIGVEFFANVMIHSDLSKAFQFKGLSSTEFLDAAARISQGGNRFSTDTSRDIAAGDFDGDGLTDVFLANGTAWFYSRAGKRPWEFLHASTKGIDELAFADINNDKTTDVLFRDGAGNVGWLEGGRKDLVPLTTTPVPLKDVRFGDFNGDSKTDMFFTKDGVWHVWDGASGQWTEPQRANHPISELLFGEFDDVLGTDVAAVLDNDWVISSGAKGFWLRLNPALIFSFKEAIAADFDGNSRTDIAYRGHNGWRFSADGDAASAPLGLTDHMMRNGVLGHFTADPKTTAVYFDKPFSFFFGESRFNAWLGFGSAGVQKNWSEHPMD